MIVTLATQLPISETVNFVKRHASKPGLRLLEVGAGEGDLALALMQSGYDVRALDNDEAKVSLAQRKGVDCRLADITEYEDDPFDLILFSRSLHHIQPLDQAIKRTRSLLAEDGTLLVDDFAPETADEDTVRFRYETEFILRGSCGLSCSTRDEYPLDPLQHWKDHLFVKHKVSDSVTIRGAIAAIFSNVEEESVPYMYRYIVDKLPRNSESLSIAQKVLREEKDLIARKMIKPIGLLMVAKV
jgi:ubiquinone/menaquinone biosynthesis C-methylase UbiE